MAESGWQTDKDKADAAETAEGALMNMVHGPARTLVLALPGVQPRATQAARCALAPPPFPTGTRSPL